VRLWREDVDGSGVLEKNELNNMLSSIGRALQLATIKPELKAPMDSALETIIS